MAMVKIELGSRCIRSPAEMAEFVEDFESHTLPKSDWTHHAHLAVGLWYVINHPEDEVLDRLRQAIRTFNEAVGGENTDSAGYHETITRFYLWHIREHARETAEQPFMQALKELLTGPAADREFPLRFYNRERLFSAEARLGWVEPDLMPALDLN